MKIGKKNYQIRIYDADYNQEAIISDARIQFYRDSINSGLGEFVFDIERTLDNWTTLADLELFKKVELYINDIDTELLIKVYSGYISRINFVETADKRTATVTCLGFVSRLAMDVYKDGTTTTISEATEEPATIFKNIIDKLRDSANGNIPFLNYTADSIKNTSLSVSVKFESDAYLDALNKVLSVCPANWFWKLNADNIFSLSSKPVVADHNFSRGAIENLQIDYSMENVRNGVLIWDNDTTYRYLADLDSQASYGRRIIKENMPGADGTDAMDKKALSILGEQESPRSSILITIADNNEFERFGDLSGYDIESIKPGQTCRLTGISDTAGAFLSKNMLIRRVTYYPTSAILEVDVNRVNIDDLLDKFKKEVNQVEKDGIPTSYTAV